MATKECWAQIDGQIAGPLTIGQLRALVSQGRVVPETMISLDKVQWSPAAKVRGLFPTEPPAAAATPYALVEPAPRHVVTPRAMRPHPRQEAPAEAQFPIIRVEHRAIYKKRFVAIYPDHVLYCKRRLPFEITEEMCHVSGELKLMDHLGRFRRVMFDDVRDVRETAGTFKPKPTRPNPPANRTCRFEFRADKGKSLKIDMPLSQVGHVRRALSQSLEDRFLVKKRGLSRIVRYIGLLFWVAAILLLWSCSSAYKRGDAGASISLITTGIACVLAGYCLCSESQRGFMSLDEYEAKLREKDQKTAPQPVLWAMPPRRSQLLGLTLKIVGVLLWFAVSTSLTYRLIVMVYNATESHLIVMVYNATESRLYKLMAFSATLCVLVGYRLCQREHDPEERRDPRRPILFLRPFEEDNAVSLQPPGFLAAFAGIQGSASAYGGTSVSDGRISWGEVFFSNFNPVRYVRLIFNRGVATAEESITRHFEKRGPVIAIGKPGERLDDDPPVVGSGGGSGARSDPIRQPPDGQAACRDRARPGWP